MTEATADLLLAHIAEHPGITAPELRSAFPETSSRDLANQVRALSKAGRIESAGFGRYRLREKRKAAVADGGGRSAFAVPMARLMAGR